MADSLLPRYLIWQAVSFTTQTTERTYRILDSPVYHLQENIVAATCCLLTTSPVVLLDWPTAYLEDKDTKSIRDASVKSKATALPIHIIKLVHIGYMSHVKSGQVVLLGNKLLLFKVLKVQNKALSVIIVPEQLRRVLFDPYYGGPYGGHMGEFKTLYRLRLRFFWPCMRENIRAWVASCAHYVSYNA